MKALKLLGILNAMLACFHFIRAQEPGTLQSIVIYGTSVTVTVVCLDLALAVIQALEVI